MSLVQLQGQRVVVLLIQQDAVVLICSHLHRQDAVTLPRHLVIAAKMGFR